MINVPRYVPMIDELEQYYSTFDRQRELFQEKMTKMTEEIGDHPATEQKVAMMHILAECSDIKVFRHFPFWFQFTADRHRGIWGGLSASWGGQYLFMTRGEKELQEYSAYFAEDRDAGRIHNWANPVGHDHHALNYDDILALGLDGLKERALKYRASADAEKLPFYDAAIESLDILAALSRRFAARAAEMLADETDEAARKNLARIAAAAAEIPMRPARTFYEALAAIMFCRECVGTLEGIGVSTYGHLDRILQPYYEADLAAGRITPAEAQDLLAALFVNTAVRFTENTAPIETSTTIILGGCDREGKTVYNDVTNLILDLEMEGRYVNVKLDCRVSKAHPEAYFKKLMALQLEGLACIVLLNDDVYIPARVAQGQDVEDVRLYVAGGCHEIVLGGTEVCTRADTWIILPGILLTTTLKKRDYASFEELYRQAIADVQAFILKVENAKNAIENHWADLNPMPLYSTMLTGCLEKGVDATAGGSKYANTALSMLSPATFIDSLWTIKTLCFDEKKYTLEEYMKIVDNNFEGEEALRQYILNRIPKYCSGDDELDGFTQVVFHVLAQTAGQKNGRGGKYLPAFYPHDAWRHKGQNMGATPDGRKAGFALSGCSPSEFLTGITPIEMLRSVEMIDFEEFADSFALEVTLPTLRGVDGEGILVALIEEFLENKGGTLQFNLLDAKVLKEAQEKPEEHRDLIVRVCGYSYYFVLLDEARQAEVISRALRRV